MDMTDEQKDEAIRLIAKGLTWEQVVQEIFPDIECPELATALMQGTVHAHYKSLTSEYIKSLVEDACEL